MDHKLSKSAGGDAGATEVDLASSTEFWRTNTSCQSESPQSKQASSVLCLDVAARCCSVLRRLDALLIEPKSPSQLQIRHGPRSWFRLTRYVRKVMRLIRENSFNWRYVYTHLIFFKITSLSINTPLPAILPCVVARLEVLNWDLFQSCPARFLFVSPAQIQLERTPFWDC